MTVAVVLAGGQSSRMGQDKSSLLYGGKTLLHIIVEKLRAAGIAQVVVSGSVEQAHFADRVIADHGVVQGPLAGIVSVLEELSPTEQDFLFVPVDMPALAVTDIDHLVAYGSTHRQVCCYRNCFLPLYLCNAQETLEQIAAMHQQGVSMSVRGLLQRLGGVYIEPIAGERMINVNTPAEWQAYCGLDN